MPCVDQPRLGRDPVRVRARRDRRRPDRCVRLIRAGFRSLVGDAVLGINFGAGAGAEPCRNLDPWSAMPFLASARRYAGACLPPLPPEYAKNGIDEGRPNFRAAAKSANAPTTYDADDGGPRPNIAPRRRDRSDRLARERQVTPRRDARRRGAPRPRRHDDLPHGPGDTRHPGHRRDPRRQPRPRGQRAGRVPRRADDPPAGHGPERRACARRATTRSPAAPTRSSSCRSTCRSSRPTRSTSSSRRSASSGSGRSSSSPRTATAAARTASLLAPPDAIDLASAATAARPTRPCAPRPAPATSSSTGRSASTSTRPTTCCSSRRSPSRRPRRPRRPMPGVDGRRRLEVVALDGIPEVVAGRRSRRAPRRRDRADAGRRCRSATTTSSSSPRRSSRRRRARSST